GGGGRGGGGGGGGRGEVREGGAREGGEREHGRLAPQDLRRRDRRQRHRLDLDVGARLIGVDLQEHVADAQGRALVMGDDDLDLFHVGHYRGMIIDVAADLSRANRNAASRAWCGPSFGSRSVPRVDGEVVQSGQSPRPNSVALPPALGAACQSTTSTCTARSPTCSTALPVLIGLAPLGRNVPPVLTAHSRTSAWPRVRAYTLLPLMADVRDC